MKKLISVLCTLCLMATAFGFAAKAEEAPAPAPKEVTVPDGASKWDGTVPEANTEYVFEGEGTKANPWLIRSASELALLAANVRLDSRDTTYGGKFFKLTCDIDLDNHPWVGIGGARVGSDGMGENGKLLTYFAGNFDGDYHKIYNLTLATTGKTPEGEEKTLHQQGLFGYILGARISNLGIESGNVVLNGNNRSGVLVGIARCGFQIENCYNKVDLTLTSDMKAVVTGVLVGMGVDAWNKTEANTESMTKGVCKDKRIINCYNTGNLTVTLNSQDAKNNFRVGGVLGQYVGGAPELDGVYNFGDVTVISDSVVSDNNNHCVGGICGAFLDGAYVVNTYFKGAFSVTMNAATDLSQYRLGYLFGRCSSKVTFDMDTNGVNVGYQVSEGSTEGVKAMAEPAEPEDPTAKRWYAPMENLVLPLAENSTFIVAPKGADDKPEQTTETPTQPETPTNPETPTSSPAGDDSGTKPGSVTTDRTPESTAAGTDTDSGGCASSLSVASIASICAAAAVVGLLTRRKKHD